MERTFVRWWQRLTSDRAIEVWLTVHNTALVFVLILLTISLPDAR